MATLESIHAQVECLYAAENAALVRWLVRRTGHTATAEDIAQMTWLKVLGAIARNRCDVSRPPALRGFLYTVARHTLLDECDRERGGGRVMPIDPARLDELSDDASDGDPESNLARHQARARLAVALGRLPDEQRRVAVLWAEGASIRELSAACAAPADTVLSRKKYAFAKLRRELEPAMLLG